MLSWLGAETREWWPAIGAARPAISTSKRCMECPGKERHDLRARIAPAAWAQRWVRTKDPISVPTRADGTAINSTARPISSAPHWVSGSLQKPARKTVVATAPTIPPTRRPVPVCERVLRVSVRQSLELSGLQEWKEAPRACPSSWTGLARQRPIASSAGAPSRVGIAGGDARGTCRYTFRRWEGRRVLSLSSMRHELGLTPAHAGLSTLAATLEATRTMRVQTVDLVTAARDLRRIEG